MHESSAADWRGFWGRLHTSARLTGEVFKRLGWTLPTTDAGEVPRVKTRRASRTLYAPTYAELLALVEHAEVERRARIHEREYTRAVAEACGWRLVAAQQRRWEAEHERDSRRVLRTEASAVLRALLRMSLPDPAPEVPWAAPSDVAEVSRDS